MDLRFLKMEFYLSAFIKTILGLLASQTFIGAPNVLDLERNLWRHKWTINCSPN